VNAEKISEDEAQENLEINRFNMYRKWINGWMAYVKDTERDENAEIAPMVLVKNVEGVLEELVSRADAAELAGRSGIGIVEISASDRHVGTHILVACQA